MANVIVVGAQWGDEGKAKITDLLAEHADVVIRCQGGCNAGHTVMHQNQVFKFHLIPSGLLYSDKICVIGPGTVIDPAVLLKEIHSMQEKNYSLQHLKISDRAHLTLPEHTLLDQYQESHLATKKIGTTGKGIGPTYMDKVGRLGLRMGDLLESETVLRERLHHIAALKQPIFEALLPPDKNTDIETRVNTWFAFCEEYKKALGAYIFDTIPLVHELLYQNKSVLFEGAQGTLLDVDFGTYPYVTSSNATAGGACTGSGIGPSKIDHVIGVMKAYTTRVGEGPFPTELNDEIGTHLVEVGQEYGTTTGRKRRCGWFDAVIGKYSVQVNGLDSVAITKLDIFDGLKEIKVCVAYQDTETGEMIPHFPGQLSTLKKASPVYQTFPGWQGSVKEVRHYDGLPKEAKHYLLCLSELIGTPISIVSVGANREQTIMIENPLKGKSQSMDRPLKSVHDSSKKVSEASETKHPSFT